MNSNIPIISFVSPVYRAEKILDKLVEEINNVMLKLDVSYEIILVDDRSPDDSWKVIQQIATNQNHVKGYRLSKNFGQHPTIMAGLSQAKGEWVVVMDCDLQDQPKEVEKLYKKALEGYNVVLAKRKERKDSFMKKMSSYLFSKTYSFFTDTKYDNEIANFGIYNKKVIDEVLKISDKIKFFPLFVKLVGFSTVSIDVEHAEREEGNSSYSFAKLLSLAFNTIVSFSNKPLKLMIKFGMLVSILSFIFGLYNLYLWFANEIKVIGYASLIVSIWFLSGIVITSLGLVGIYIGKIFDQTKDRSVFIIDEKV